MLCVRAEATSRARPVPASQAERVRIVRGRMNDEGCDWSEDIVRAKKMERAMPSRQRRVERRWLWWVIRPMMQREKENKKNVLVGVMFGATKLS